MNKFNYTDFYEMNKNFSGKQILLIQKMQKEFNDYIDGLRSLDKETIISKSDETSIKSEFLSAFAIYYNANNDVADDLLKQDKPLDYLTKSYFKLNYAEYGSCQMLIDEMYNDESYESNEADEFDLEN